MYLNCCPILKGIEKGQLKKHYLIKIWTSLCLPQIYTDKSAKKCVYRRTMKKLQQLYIYIYI